MDCGYLRLPYFCYENIQVNVLVCVREREREMCKVAKGRTDELDKFTKKKFVQLVLGYESKFQATKQ
jgi:hypothetical protein